MQPNITIQYQSVPRFGFGDMDALAILTSMDLLCWPTSVSTGSGTCNESSVGLSRGVGK